MTSSPRTIHPWARRLLLAAGILAACYLVYGRLPLSLLRAESGIYLNRGANSPGEWLGFAATRFTRSYSGHYTPLAFNVELVCATLFGPAEAPWRLRQLIYLSFFVAAALAFWGQAAAWLGLSGAGRRWFQLGLTSLFALSPLLIELVPWPFMGMQILWATTTTLSLLWIGRALDGQAGGGEASLRALGWALAFAYGSLHCLGLGLATMAGYVAVVAVLLGAARVRRASAAYRRRLALLGGSAVALALAHGGMMIFAGRPGPPRAGFAGGPLELFIQGLGYVSCCVFACGRSLWSPNAWAMPRGDLLAQEWPYGAGVVLLALLYACQLWRDWRAGDGDDNRHALGRLCWHVFSLAAFGIGVLLIALRVWGGDQWIGYLLGTRYLWPLAVLLSGTLGSLVSHLRWRDRALAPAFGALLTGVCALGNLVYQQGVAPKIWPDSTLSHERVWRDIVAMTGELHAAQLPLPDLPMQRLVVFTYPLRTYEKLLRRSRQLPAGMPLNWIAPARISPSLWEEMKRRSPALAGLARTVFAETDRELSALPAARRESDGGAVIALTDPALLRGAQLAHVKDHRPNLGVPIEVNGVSKPSIWMNPPTAITFPQLPLGERPRFRCAVTIHPHVWGEAGADGAVFRVSVCAEDGATEIVGERYLNPIAHPAERTWNSFEVDLSKYAGQRVDLVLENAAGPAGNDYADWCIWGDAELVERP